MTKSASKLKRIKETEFINDGRNGVTKQTRYYEMNGEKFIIKYENSNGSCLGFNSKMCLQQYSKADACWNNLEDIGVLSMSAKIPNYFGEVDSKRHAEEFFTKMEKHLIIVYA